MNQQQQFDMDVKQRFDTELRERLEAMEFPVEKIPQGLRSWLLSAMKHESKQSIGCDMKALEEMHDYHNCATASMFVMGFIINTVEKQTPTALKVDNETYVPIIKQITTMGEQWNAIVAPIRDEIMQKLTTPVPRTVVGPKLKFQKGGR